MKIITILILFIFNSLLAKEEIYKIGVLAKRGKETAILEWSKTLNHLNKNSKKYKFEIVPLTFKEVYIAVRAKEIDFIITNSAMFIELSNYYGVRKIATMLKRDIFDTNQTLFKFGSVLFTKSKNLNLRNLKDLKDKSLVAVNESSFGGWYMTYRELKERGVDPYKYFSKVSFLGTHDRVVEEVMSEKADAGVVRSGILESLRDERNISLKDIFVFKLNSNSQKSFPLLLSTRLYPEWPISKLSHVDESVSKEVAKLLLEMDLSKDVNSILEPYSWTTPLDYYSVDETLKYLKVPPYQNYGDVEIEDILEQYGVLIFIISISISIIILLSLHLLKLNRELKSKNQSILNFNKSLEHTIESRTKELKESRDFLKNISNSMGEGIIVSDIDGVGIYVNLAAEKILGYSSSEVIGEDIHKLIHYIKPNGDYYPKEECPIHSLNITNSNFFKIDETQFIRKDKKSIDVLVTYTPNKKDGKIVGSIIVFQDITSKKEIERNLRYQQTEIEKLLDRELYIHSILKTVADINQYLIISNSESELLHKSCNRLSEFGYYELVWIGLESEGSLKLAMGSKDRVSYLYEIESILKESDVDSIYPSIRAFKHNENVIINDITIESKFDKYRERALEMGFTSLIAIPLKPDQFSNPIGSITVYSSRDEGFEKKEIEMLIELTGDIGFAINSFRQRENLESLEEERIRNYEDIIYSFVNMIEQRDTYTAGHTTRVAEYSKLIARELGFNEKDINLLYQSAVLHDIGKIATPDAILLKPGKLNDLEYSLIKEHVNVGYEMLSQIQMYKELAEIMKYHHERYDGKGYPYRIGGNDIPMLSHIMILADSFDAMTTNRIYKARKSLDDAVAEINELSGKQFHPIVAEAATKVLKRIDITKNISQLPISSVEMERLSYFFKDQLTNLYNKDYLLMVLKNDIVLENSQIQSISIIYLHNFNRYNQTYGWEDGNRLLKEFATYLSMLCPDNLIFRIKGDDFVVLSRETLCEITKERVLKSNLFKESTIYLEIEEVDIPNSLSEFIDNIEKINY